MGESVLVFFLRVRCYCIPWLVSSFFPLWFCQDLSSPNWSLVSSDVFQTKDAKVEKHPHWVQWHHVFIIIIKSYEHKILQITGRRFPKAPSGSNIDGNGKTAKRNQPNKYNGEDGCNLVQMDVSNYYPMKELLRDKYFDQGELLLGNDLLKWFSLRQLVLLIDSHLL